MLRIVVSLLVGAATMLFLLDLWDEAPRFLLVGYGLCCGCVGVIVGVTAMMRGK